jgi:hypothetical protein
MLAVILIIVIGTLKLIGGKSNNVFSQVAASRSGTFKTRPKHSALSQSLMLVKARRCPCLLQSRCGSKLTPFADSHLLPGCGIGNEALGSTNALGCGTQGFCFKASFTSTHSSSAVNCSENQKRGKRLTPPAPRASVPPMAC